MKRFNTKRLTAIFLAASMLLTGNVSAMAAADPSEEAVESVSEVVTEAAAEDEVEAADEAEVASEAEEVAEDEAQNAEAAAGDAESVDEADADFPVDETAASYLMEESMTPKSYGSDYFIKFSGSNYYESQVYIFYTDKADKDVYKGKSTIDSYPDVQATGVNYIGLYECSNNQSSSDYLEDGMTMTFTGTLDKNDDYGQKHDCLKPATAYKYRLAVSDDYGSSYKFVTGQKSFTTLAAITESKVAFKDVKVKSYDYSRVELQFKVENPDNEVISYFSYLEEGAEAPEKLYSYELEYDPDTKNYSFGFYPKKSEENVTLSAMVPLGAEAVLTEVKSEAVKVAVADYTKATLDVTLTPASASAFAAVKLSPMFKDASMSGNVYYRKKGETEYQTGTGYFGVYGETGEGITILKNLEPETDYEYYADIHISGSEEKGDRKAISFASKDAPKSFKTTALKTFAASDFANEDLYKYILKQYGGNDGKSENLTSADLEEVSEFTLEGSDLKDAGLKPLTSVKGIENMVNLRSLDLNGNDITDATGVEKLVNLSSLDLNNNLLTDIPVLKELKTLYSLGLDGNKLTKETLTEEKLPDKFLDQESYKQWYTNTLSNQQKTVKLSIPEKFYAIGSTWPFFAKAANNAYPREGRKYYITAELDGKTIKSTVGNYSSVWVIEDLAKEGVSMAAGSKDIKVTLYDEYDNKLLEQDVKAEFAADGMIVKKDEYIIGETYASVDVIIPDIETQSSISGIKVLDAQGAEIPLRSDNDYHMYTESVENRYDYTVNALKRKSANVWLYMNFTDPSKLVPGDYSVSFTLDGKTYTAEKCIHVLKEGEGAVIEYTGYANTSEFDDSGDFIYLSVYGSGLYDATKVLPVLKIDDKAYTGKYVEARVDDDEYGFIYKLPKEKELWKDLGRNATFDIVLETPDEKYTVIDNRGASGKLLSLYDDCDPVLFSFFNYRTGYYTADVASFVADGTAVGLKIEQYDSKGNWATALETEAAVQSGKLKYEVKTSDGKDFILQKGKSYRYTYTFPENIYAHKTYMVERNTTWFNFAVSMSLVDTKTIYKAPVSSLPVKLLVKSELLNKEKENKVEFTLRNNITGEEVSTIELKADNWINKYKGEFSGTFDLASKPLGLGKYRARVKVDGVENSDSSVTFVVYDDAAFYMDSQYAYYYVDEKEGDYVQLSIADPKLAVDYAEETDGKKIWDERGYKLQVFKLTETDNGKENWTELTDKVTIAAVSDHDKDSQYLRVKLTGLEKSEDGYWFRVTVDGKNGLYILAKDDKGNIKSYYKYDYDDEEHGKQGASYSESESSEPQDYVSLESLENDEVGYGWYYGLEISNGAYPYTVYIYEPGQTKALAAINVKSGKKEKNSSYEYYYFTKSDLKAITNTTVYDMVVVNSIGKRKADARGYIDVRDSKGENDQEEDVLPPVPTDVPTAADAPEMTASDKAEALNAYTKAVEEINSKKDGNGEAAKAAVDDTGVVIPLYKKGNVKSVAVESAKKSVKDFTVTVLAKSKVALPGKAAYTITLGEADSVSGNAVSGNSAGGSVAGVKVPAAKVGKDGVTMVAAKAAKGVNEYVLTCKSEEYTVRLRVVNVAFDKNIKKAALYTGAGEAGKGCGEMLAVGVQPRKFINGVWSAGKQVLNMGTNKVKCGKSFAFVYVMENGTAVVEPMTGAAGAVKLTYTVSGKKFSTSVKASSKPLSAKQEAARAPFKSAGLLKVPTPAAN